MFAKSKLFEWARRRCWHTPCLVLFTSTDTIKTFYCLRPSPYIKIIIKKFRDVSNVFQTTQRLVSRKFFLYVFPSKNRLPNTCSFYTEKCFSTFIKARLPPTHNAFFTPFIHLYPRLEICLYPLWQFFKETSLIFHFIF